MTNPTSNFGWQMPTSTDLVTDLPADFEVFGQAVDTSLAELKGGTTGQVLSKTSNTDMDFTWVTTDDANAIQNSIVDAKGDIVAASANDTPARLAVGNNGETLVADSSTATGLRYQSNFAAGKNKIINGDMNIWQRGTSITVPIANNIYSGTDRFCFSRNGTSSVITCSRQAFTPGTAPVAGYESNYFMRLNQTVAGSGMTYNETQYKIEDVTTFAGQTVTFSFWAKADSPRTVPQVVLIQNFGSGGSSQVNTNIMTSLSITTSWQRFTATITLPSISGKTIGTSSFLEIDMQLFMNTTFTFDTWGWQLEAGSVATAFQTATGTFQGELAACQRYFQLITGGGEAFGGFYLTTAATLNTSFPVQMRVAPTPTYNTTFTNAVDQVGTALRTPTGYSAAYVDTNGICILATGMSSATVGNPAVYIGGNHQLSAEL